MKFPIIRRDKLNDDEFLLLKKESVINYQSDILIHEFIVRKFPNKICIVASSGYTRKYTKEAALICNSYTEFMNAYLELKLEFRL